ncbi:MAG: T9SS type A sorting domain-containing protein [Saprospiraceae bacterium]|nr:T9SS type A sorting domain-containing protein [Saprospiraceae bacterium]
MKKLLFTFLGLCISVFLFAQNPPCMASVWPTNYDNGATTLSAIDSSSAGISSYLWSTGATTPTIDVTADGLYCVTITYADGCVATACDSLVTSNCWSYASVWPTAGGYYVSAYGFPYYLDATYLWSNGVTSSGFTTTESGTYCVTVTRENGCTSTACVTVNAPAPSCSASVTPIDYENGVTTLSAVDSVYSPVSSFLWSTGATSSTIDVTSQGVYCVTITYANGCVASACDTLLYDDCWSYASAWPAGTGLYVSASGAPDYLDATYEWSNGETSSAFSTVVEGTYCVTVTRENGCTSTACVEAFFPSTSFTVWVAHPDSNSNPIIADVYLIKYDSIAGTLQLAYTQQTSFSGAAVFPNITPGSYLIKAAIVAGTVGYTDYLPTYGNSALLWSDANHYNVYTYSAYGSYIYLIPGNNPGGPGFIGGLVSEGANLTGQDQTEFNGEGDPVAGASVVITLPDGTAVAATTTNASGAYSFPSLAYGTYIVTINILGVTPVSTTVTLSPAQPGFSGINFNVTENGATLSAKDVDFEAFAKVSPNPVRDVLQVDLRDSEGELLLTNMQGQIVQKVAVSATQMRLSLASLPEGVYMLTARTTKGSQSTRIVKQ